MIFGYIRVSTKGQNEARQIESLKDYVNIDNTYIDKATGKNFNRPQYMELKKILREGDTLYIKSLDRLGRNKQDTLKEIQWFKDRGILLKVLDIPTTLTDFPEGQKWVIDLVNNIIIEVYTSIAENELNTIKSRQREGIDAMPVNEATGKKVSLKTGRETGRPERVVNNDFISVYERVQRKELTNKEAWTLLNMSKATYYRYIKEYKESLEA